MLRDAMSFSARTDDQIRTMEARIDDQNTLAAWVAAMPEPPGEIRLVHGEPRAKAVLARKLRYTNPKLRLRE
jgi:predicted metal-dependent RNase